MDRELWKLENYLDFLKARRELLASSANSFLDSLLSGSLEELQSDGSILDRRDVVSGGFDNPEEEYLLREANDWVISQGLPEGEFGYELIDQLTGEPLAILDLAWPTGLQEGFSQPVALLIDEDVDLIRSSNDQGFRSFIETDALKKYIQEEVLTQTSPIQLSNRWDRFANIRE